MKKKCAACNNELTSSEYLLDGEAFCSHKCLEVAQLSKDIYCAWCGNTCNDKQDYISINNRNYCSPTCAIEAQDEIICQTSTKYKLLTESKIQPLGM